MAKVKFIVNDKLFRKEMRKIDKYVNRTMPKEALKIYKKETPEDSGNARRKTKLQRRTVIGDYPYAGVLDDGLYPNPPKGGKGKTSGGYSKDAPRGMATPTIEKLQVKFEQFVRRLTGK